MTKADHLTAAMDLTKEQLAELKAAFGRATKDRLAVDGISYVASEPDFLSVPVYADLWTADPINGHRLCRLPYDDAQFFALAHNLMPALVAAAEEAERLKADVERLTQENAAMREALGRLGGSAAFTYATVLDPDRDEELLARMDYARAALAQFDAPAAEAENKFDEWIRELNEDVIQGEYGYEPLEFTVYPDHWRSAFDEGLSPKQAFDRSLKACEDARNERDRTTAANYELIKAKDRATIAEFSLSAARQTLAEAVEIMRKIDRPAEREESVHGQRLRCPSCNHAWPVGNAAEQHSTGCIAKAARAFVEKHSAPAKGGEAEKREGAER